MHLWTQNFRYLFLRHLPPYAPFHSTSTLRYYLRSASEDVRVISHSPILMQNNKNCSPYSPFKVFLSQANKIEALSLNLVPGWRLGVLYIDWVSKNDEEGMITENIHLKKKSASIY